LRAEKAHTHTHTHTHTNTFIPSHFFPPSVALGGASALALLEKIVFFTSWGFIYMNPVHQVPNPISFRFRIRKLVMFRRFSNSV
jgi:hypothetical protein